MDPQQIDPRQTRLDEMGLVQLWPEQKEPKNQHFYTKSLRIRFELVAYHPISSPKYAIINLLKVKKCKVQKMLSSKNQALCAYLSLYTIIPLAH